MLKPLGGGGTITCIRVVLAIEKNHYNGLSAVAIVAIGVVLMMKRNPYGRLSTVAIAYMP